MFSLHIDSVDKRKVSTILCIPPPHTNSVNGNSVRAHTPAPDITEAASWPLSIPQTPPPHQRSSSPNKVAVLQHSCWFILPAPFPSPLVPLAHLTDAQRGPYFWLPHLCGPGSVPMKETPQICPTAPGHSTSAALASAHPGDHPDHALGSLALGYPGSAHSVSSQPAKTFRFLHSTQGTFPHKAMPSRLGEAALCLIHGNKHKKRKKKKKNEETEEYLKEQDKSWEKELKETVEPSAW